MVVVIVAPLRMGSGGLHKLSECGGDHVSTLSIGEQATPKPANPCLRACVLEVGTCLNPVEFRFNV